MRPLDELAATSASPTCPVAPSSPPRPRVPWLLLLVLLVAPVLSCHTTDGGALAVRTPALLLEVATALARDNPAAFEREVRRTEPRALGALYMRLMSELPAAGPGFEAEERRRLGPIRQVVARLREEANSAYLARAFEAYQRRPVEERARCVELLRRMIATHLDQGLDLPGRARAYEALLRESLPFGDVINRGDMFGPYCEILSRLNRDGELAHNFDEGTECSLAYGDTAQACQFLGALGTHYGHSGNDSLMKVCWDRALLLARANRNWHEARILSFYASTYMERGDPTRAIELLARAEARCRELKADETEIRFLYARLGLFAELSCWDLVERNLRRADVLIRAGQGKWQPDERTLWQARMLAIRMRLAEARQADTEAGRDARELVTLAATRPPGPDRERLNLAAAQTLARLGRAAEARALLAGLLANCETYGVPELVPEGRLRQAELALASGDEAAADSALARFRRATWADADAVEAWIRHDLLTARLAWQRHDRSAALRTLAGALDRLEARGAALGASPEAYLMLGRFQGLRTLFHEMTVGEPRLGYLFELGWADLRFARHGTDDDRGPARVARLAFRGADAPLPELPAGSVHCVYAFCEHDVLRWTRSGPSVTRERLATPPTELRNRVDAVAARLARAGGDASAGPEARRELGALARLLLPAELLAADDHRLLLVSPEGPLARLPFEALSRSADDYLPLLGERDVAYLDGLARSAPAGAIGAAPTTPALVVTAPAYDATLARRWSALNEPLPASVDEARQFAAAVPGALLLRDREATRRNLLARWESAREIYLALHFVRDPELSYEDYLPLAGDGVTAGDVEGAACVGLREVQRADLSRCALVVLSGCGTGVRYAAGTAEIPSLGDMFAKAGAAAVVQTGWSVRDADGAAVMHRFNERYARGRRDPVTALGDARRDLIRLGFPPNVWAAYTLLLSPPAEEPATARNLETAWNRRR